MPKLNKKMAGQVESAEESSGFALMEEGLYPMVLKEVKVSDDEGPSGFHFWTWIYEVPEDAEEYAKSRIWNVTSLSPGAQGMPGGLKRTFSAFGVSADTDTDELCGETILVHVGQEVAQKGKNKGKMQNTCIDVFPPDYDPDEEGEGGPGF